ncbi:hypothetical protein VTN00DRAFT_529 [Thermoascus crustaceus]|uniref:uncharacterized protein n=1 Tax=Thermoascus crustaceus TaxID=5088 RepID=UPI0037442D19
MGTMKMEVDFKDGPETKTNTYAGVFNSTTLGCLKRIDTSKAGLNYTMLRSKRFGPWVMALPRRSESSSSVHGGYMISAATTSRWVDWVIRTSQSGTCVYPSYDIYDPPTEPAVLLRSYIWQQDALRIRALMSDNPDHTQKVEEEADLKELLFRDLARLHKSDDMSEEELYRLISDNYIDHHAYDRYHDPNTADVAHASRPGMHAIDSYYGTYLLIDSLLLLLLLTPPLTAQIDR